VDRASEEAALHTSASSNFVFFNRIPKAGSTTMTELLSELSKLRNGTSGWHGGRQFTVHNIPSSHYYATAPFEPNTTWSATWDDLRNIQKNASVRGVHKI
jgi:hypothetical protein